MILVAGPLSEVPVQAAVLAAAAEALDCVVLNERDAGRWEVTLEVADSGMAGRVVADGRTVDLASVSGAYLRITGASPPNPSALVDPDEPARARAAVQLLTSWSQATRLRVANRPEAMASNASKPYQAQLIRQVGFATPSTLVTNDPQAVEEFRAAHGRLVYKSCSGFRSIVHELPPGRDLEPVRALPTQFQELLTGTNVRVHVVGDQVYACRITSAAVDYRYAERDGLSSEMEPYQLPTQVAERCVLLCQRLGLPLAGVDLLVDDEGKWWCFEVNPSPAYTCFGEATALSVARALVCWLEWGTMRAEVA